MRVQMGVEILGTGKKEGYENCCYSNYILVIHSWIYTPLDMESRLHTKRNSIWDWPTIIVMTGQGRDNGKIMLQEISKKGHAVCLWWLLGASLHPPCVHQDARQCHMHCHIIYIVKKACPWHINIIIITGSLPFVATFCCHRAVCHSPWHWPTFQPSRWRTLMPYLSCRLFDVYNIETKSMLIWIPFLSGPWRWGPNRVFSTPVEYPWLP